jgi:hypothetical protein
MGDEDEFDPAVWTDFLQQRLDAADRDNIDPRPWREVLDDIRARLREKHDKRERIQ